MASSTSRRPSWRIAAPLVAVAALGLAGCSAGQDPSDVKGTTPAVWTGAAAPAGGAEGGEHASGSSEAGGQSITSQLNDPEGKNVGTVTFTKQGDFVQIKAEVEDLKPGFHGFHIHSVGKCETDSVAPTGGAPGNFLSAGAHFQKEGHSSHPASGDLTSLQVRGDGSGELITTTDAFTLEDLNNDGKGRAIMVHADADNFANIPPRYSVDGNAGPDEATMSTGDAGGRVACGVIK